MPARSQSGVACTASLALGAPGGARGEPRHRAASVAAGAYDQLTVSPAARHPGRVADDPDQHPRPFPAPDRVGARGRERERAAPRAGSRPTAAVVARASSCAGRCIRASASTWSCGLRARPRSRSRSRSRVWLPPSRCSNIPLLQPAKLDHFVSQPTLLPPQITVHRGAGAPGGDIFLTPLPSPVIHPESNNVLTIHPVGPGGPMIVDSRGRLVWFHQLPPPFVAANFRPQRFGGREVLTWWQGGVTPSAFGIGEGVIADTSYRTLRTVRTGNGYSADIHEFLLSPVRGRPVHRLLAGARPPAGNPEGKLSPLLDSIVQEVDIRTGLVVWEWHAYGHIPLSDSYATPATSSTFDAYHLNSIQLLAHDQLLVSAAIPRRCTRSTVAAGGSCGRSAASRAASGSATARDSTSSTTRRCGRRPRQPVRRRGRAAGRRRRPHAG